MLNASLVVGALLVAFLLPGYFLARRFLRVSSWLEAVVFSIALGLSVVPTMAFLLAWALGVPFSPPIVLAPAVALILLARPWRLGPRPKASKEDLVALLVCIASAAVLLQLTDFHSVGPVGYFGSCLHSIALYWVQSDGSGTAIFDPSLDACVTYVINHTPRPILGVSQLLYDVRPANGALFTSVMVLAARAAGEIITLLVFTGIVGASTLIARTYLDDWRLRVAVGLLTLVSLHGIMAYMVNENALALAIGLVLLLLLLRERERERERERLGEAIAAGFLLGFVFGLRLPALLWLLPVALLVLSDGWRARLATAAAFVVAALPWAIVPWIVGGEPFTYRTHDGVNVAHEVLGLEFLFRPLNWPIHEQLVRIPEHVLPAVAYLPIKILQSMGSVVLSMMLIGFAVMGPAREALRFPRLLVLLWAGPLMLILLGQIYLDYEKASYVLLTLPVMPLVLAAFVSRLRRTPGRLVPLSSWAALSLGLAFLPSALARIDVPVDPRAHTVYDVVDPNGNEIEWTNPRSDDAIRRELGAVTVLPGLHEVLRSSRLWLGLSRTCRLFEAGRVHVRFGENSPDEARLTLEASVTEPPLPPSFPLKPVTVSQLLMASTLFHLRLPVGPTPTLHLRSDLGGMDLRIDAGPGPQELRYVSFLVDERNEQELAPARVQVELEGKPVHTRGLGYHVSHPRVEADRLAVVTNLEVPPQSDTASPIFWLGSFGTGSWHVYGPDGSPDPGGPADPGGRRRVEARQPAIGVSGPVLFPY